MISSLRQPIRRRRLLLSCLGVRCIVWGTLTSSTRVFCACCLIPSLRHATSLLLDDTTKLESCIRGQIESQSISLWALTSVFEFLRESDCVPDSPVFHQLVSMTLAINAQVCASFSAAIFLKQIRHERLVSHLLSSTHASVKHALWLSPSTSSFFFPTT